MNPSTAPPVKIISFRLTRPVLFLEMYILDASDFSADLLVRGVEVGSHRVLRAQSAAVPNAIAASCSTCETRPAKSRMPISIGVKAIAFFIAKTQE